MSKIANIVKSISHKEYIAQAINPAPKETKYGLGQFVLIAENIVGIIHDTELFNPNSIQITLQKEDIEIFDPTFKDEVDILLKIIILGSLRSYIGNQNLPSETIIAASPVRLMKDSEIQAFHHDENGKLQIKYLIQNPSISSNTSLLELLCSNLKEILSEQEYRILHLIKKDSYWLSFK